MMYFEKYHHFMCRMKEKLCWVPPLLLRLTLAGVFINTGWGKIHNFDKVTAFFIQLGISHPAFQAHFVGYTELVCGIFMLIGLLTRFAAIALSIIMITALITAHGNDVQNLSSIFGVLPFLYLVFCFCLIITGAGKFSVDHLIAHKHCHTTGQVLNK